MNWMTSPNLQCHQCQSNTDSPVSSTETQKPNMSLSWLKPGDFPDKVQDKHLIWSFTWQRSSWSVHHLSVNVSFYSAWLSHNSSSFQSSIYLLFFSNYRFIIWFVKLKKAKMHLQISQSQKLMSVLVAWTMTNNNKMSADEFSLGFLSDCCSTAWIKSLHFWVSALTNSSKLHNGETQSLVCSTGSQFKQHNMYVN